MRARITSASGFSREFRCWTGTGTSWRTSGDTRIRSLRDKYLGDGTPDDGFAISLISGKVDDFNISKGRCLVDGFEAVNREDTSYSKQTDVPPLTIPTAKRTDLVYIDLWISEIHGTDDLKNDQDVKIETAARHKVEWRVKVSEAGKKLLPKLSHHYYTIASIERDGATITAINDLRTALSINPLFKALSVSAGNIGIGSENPSRPLTVRAAVASQELISLEDPNGKVKWHINQNLGGNNPGLNFVETGVADGRLFLKAGGNVGINNVNPQRSLHVEGSEVHSGGTIAGFSFANRDAPNNGAYVEGGADGQRWVWYAKGQAARLWAAGDKLVVDKNGNVMISHGPQKGAKAADNVGLKLSSADGGGVIYGFNLDHSIFFRMGQDGASNVTDYHQYGTHRFFAGGVLENQPERMRITSGGAVAIGTTDPKRTLHVEGSEIHSGVHNGGANAGFSFANSDAPNNGAFEESGADGKRWVWYARGQVARLWAAGDKLAVDKNGNVGIGTVSPVAKLQLSGDLIIEKMSTGAKKTLPGGAAMIWNDGDWLRIGQNLDYSVTSKVHTPGLFATGIS